MASHTMVDEEIAIAVIGCGLIGPRHAQSILAYNRCRLLCFVDPGTHAHDVAATFRVPVFPSVQQMLTHGYHPDAGIVCTPNSTHASVAKEMLLAGIHVLVEKPIATTISDGHDLVQTARLNNRALLVGHHRRFNSHLSATKRALQDGQVGRVIAVSGIWSCYKPEAYFKAPTEWRGRKGDGGVILINMIHEVDILQYLLGRIVKVHAEKIMPVREHEAEEGASILFRFASGVVGTFYISDATPSAHSFEQGTGENPTIPKSGQDFLRIFGTEGTLSVGDMKLTKHKSGVSKSWLNPLQESTVTTEITVPFDEQIKNFVGVLRGEERPRCLGDDGLAALIVCDAIKQALESGDAVNISEIV